MTVTAYPTSLLTAGGQFALYIDLDLAGEDASTEQVSPGGSETLKQVSACLAWKLPVGAVLRAQVQSLDGAVSRAYQLYAIVAALLT